MLLSYCPASKNEYCWLIKLYEHFLSEAMTEIHGRNNCWWISISWQTNHRHIKKRRLITVQSQTWVTRRHRWLLYTHLYMENDLHDNQWNNRFLAVGICIFSWLGTQIETLKDCNAELQGGLEKGGFSLNEECWKGCIDVPPSEPGTWAFSRRSLTWKMNRRGIVEGRHSEDRCKQGYAGVPLLSLITG